MEKLLIMSKKQQTKDGRTFKKFFTNLLIEVEGEREKGLQQKSVTVLFGKNVDTSAIIRGIVEVEEKDLSLPRVWKITVDEKTGKDRYPFVKIYSIASYTPKQAKSTARPVLEDENDTEEADID